MDAYKSVARSYSPPVTDRTEPAVLLSEPNTAAAAQVRAL